MALETLDSKNNDQEISALKEEIQKIIQETNDALGHYNAAIMLATPTSESAKELNPGTNFSPEDDAQHLLDVQRRIEEKIEDVGNQNNIELVSMITELRKLSAEIGHKLKPKEQKEAA